MLRLTAKNVPGKKIIVRIVIAFIELLSWAIFKAMSTLTELSCWVTRLNTYEDLGYIDGGQWNNRSY